MVKNGDAHKPIWISEMNWNALPSHHPSLPHYGRVTPEQQARYAVEAYRRAQAEWPWIGVVNFWFFKRASDAERDQAWYYFRMMEADFSPLPVYEALNTYATQTPVMYQGLHQADHWTVTWEGEWEQVDDERVLSGIYRTTGDVGARVRLAFDGRGLSVIVKKGAEEGRFRATLDGDRSETFDLRAEESQFGFELTIANGLRPGEHRAILEVVEGDVTLEGFVVRGYSALASTSVSAPLVAASHARQRGN